MKTKICLSLDKELVDNLKKLASKEDRTISNYINIKLKEYLKLCNK